MARFSGYWGYRAMLLFWLAICGSGVAFFALMPGRSNDATGLIFRGIMVLMAGGMGAFALYGMVESFTTYDVDANGVTRRGWNGARWMQWSDVARFQTSGQRDSTLTLTDHGGQKLSIERGLMGSQRAGELNSLLDAYLAPVHERQLRDLGSLNNVYHPKRAAAWAGVILSVIVGLMMAFFLSMPPRGNEWIAKVILFAIFGSMELLFAYITVLAFTHSLTVSKDGLTESSVFRTRTIPFHHVTSVMARTVSTKNGSYDLTTIEGDGQKIMLTSQMNDYSLLVEFIRKHVDEAANKEGQVKAEEVKRKNEKQTRILMPLFAAIYMVFLVGVGWMSFRDGNARLQADRLLDAQGQTTTGRIVGTTTTGSKHVTYLIQYAFTDASGQQITSKSPVAFADYEIAQVGAPVSVTYVPGRQDVNRIAQSTGRKKAEGDVRSGYVFITLGIVFPIFLALTPFLKHKKAEERSV